MILGTAQRQQLIAVGFLTFPYADLSLYPWSLRAHTLGKRLSCQGFYIHKAPGVLETNDTLLPGQLALAAPTQGVKQHAAPQPAQHAVSLGGIVTVCRPGLGGSPRLQRPHPTRAPTAPSADARRRAPRCLPPQQSQTVLAWLLDDDHGDLAPYVGLGAVRRAERPRGSQGLARQGHAGGYPKAWP